eukprot:656515-Prymnesium_polylepis.2
MSNAPQPCATNSVLGCLIACGRCIARLTYSLDCVAGHSQYPGAWQLERRAPLQGLQITTWQPPRSSEPRAAARAPARRHVATHPHVPCTSWQPQPKQA